MTVRQLTAIDRIIIEADKALTTIWGVPDTTSRPIPGAELAESELSASERRHSAALMRINDAGEVSAQALYQGQALTARLPDVRQAMEQAALEENDHLVWCQSRIVALGGRRSLLNPFWYAGSFALGALAGKVGDRWSLGFVAETERQVIEHLDEHLASISEHDLKSRAVIAQMKIDEAHHGSLALQAGGAPLPAPVKTLMGLMSKVMTRTSYWL
ncbi:2-octaprenyl-3-methyl-6-methoxy-1,4-benzoquinol hydroxylase [Methylophaga lonarensis MPL]|uniref:3-demethoxyubiquinol 3-hydroxylase n=1 Tax=Methylophaga lonarensis MPL TaxID=1286106 RepID=M7NUD1_9GAMM|nr:2-polyprenyl-3-methyl-6-methoxy-1,4-benzoquinone monooxygenase [Methylophaga lonarensis]EMR12378.1 2-octaprenyl-3-methyl-6-methoxy-1,4-benzoquinol hydroxylase [Methylophaga lonarensis MPL]